TLPVDAPHGSWTIVVRSPEGIVHRQSFNVENITPLAVDLRIEPQRMVYVRGEMIKATISARTWYGEPLAGTAIVVHFNDGHEERFVLDEEGQVQIEQDSRDELGSEVRLMVQIPEYGLSRAASVILADSMWQLALQIPRENGDYIVGESVPVMVTATDAAGEPVERDVKVRLVRRTRSNGRWVESTLEEHQIHTAEDGRAEVRIPLTSAGSHSIVAEGLDRIGNRITSRIGVTVSGDDEQRGLIWLVEKTRLDVGEKVELDLQNTRASSPALLTIIGDGILQYRVVDLSDGRNQVDVDVASSMYPEATVSLAMMEGGQLHEAAVVFRIRKQLQLEVIAPTEGVIPGAEVTLEVITRNLQGEGVPAEIALAVVDVAVDDLYPDWFSDLTGSLERTNRSSIEMVSSTSCDFEYHGETMQISQ
ncbi:MAG TPA: hypothetical protein EYO84_01625, partial [Planctomycetes bacterium]|nr:hypothetical protein [Planctomycetota bacterium]